MGRAVFLIVVIALAGVVGSFGAPPAQASRQFLQWSDGSSVTTFGGSQAITIDLGAVDFISDCGGQGVNDAFFPVSDIFVVPSGVTAGSLSDVTGGPNTIIGASDGTFVSETVGFTAPGGSVGPGTYAIVFDECQDGLLDANDAVFDPAFSVDVQIDVPGLPPGEIAAIKARAATAEQRWEDAHEAYEWLFKIAKVVKANKTDIAKTLNKLILETAGKLGTDPKKSALALLAAHSSHYAAIAADPPDADYLQLTGLAARPSLAADADDAIVNDIVGVENAAGREGAVTQALLHALERYQGADAAGNGGWALVHAREIRNYASLLAAEADNTTVELAGTAATLSADPRDFDALASAWETFRSGVIAGGLSAADRQELRNAGLTAAQLTQLQSEIIATDLSATDRATVQSGLAGMQTDNDALAADLTQLASAMGPIIVALESDPLVLHVAPVGDAGGPYAASQNNPILLDGSGSSGATTIASYEWDLDGDGGFDDATGVAPTATFPEAGDLVIGLLVTDSDGNQGVGFASVHVASTNGKPSITSLTPGEDSVTVEVGHGVAFGTAAIDDGPAPIGFAWSLNGSATASGPSYPYTAMAPDLGVNGIELRITDGAGGVTSHEWTLIVINPDGDGDGWRPPADCDDAKASVNPAAPEVAGNGVDDDCDPATADAGGPPPKVYNSITRPDGGSASTGMSASIKLDASGLPVIAYRSASGINVMHCNDVDCAGANESIAAISGFHNDSSLQLDASGRPVVAFDGVSLLHCNDIDCTGADDIPQVNPQFGEFTSFQLDQNGLPVIAFRAASVFGIIGLSLLHCNDANCAGGDDTAEFLVLGATERVSLALDADGHPVIAYIDASSRLRVMHCNDVNCAGGDESDELADGGSVQSGARISLTLDASGFPIVAYAKATGNGFTALGILHCDDANCAPGGDSIQTPASGDRIVSPSLVLDNSGSPVVAYYGQFTGTTKLLKCNDPNCAGGDDSNATVDNTGGANDNGLSVALDAAGRPVIAYLDGQNPGLKVAHCALPDCSTTPLFTRTTDRNVAAFTHAMCGSPTTIDFDGITAGTDVGGTVIGGARFVASGAPLTVVRGADTFTPVSFDSGFVGTHTLIPTSGENVLSPGGVVLGPGSDPNVENDDLTLTFATPVAAVGFDVLWQSADGSSSAVVKVFDSEAHLLFTETVPSTQLGGTGSGSPGGRDFWGVLANDAVITRVVVDETDADGSNPDSNIGYDTLRFSSEPCVYDIPAPTGPPCAAPPIAPPYILPFHYLKKADSPFLASINDGTTFFDDFEDGTIDLPGIGLPGATVTTRGGALTDSVDGDDGILDGSGINGRNIFSGNITITFDAAVLGGFPDHVGVVWTDGGQGAATDIEAFDAFGASFGVQRFFFADGFITGETAEDCFVGVVYPAGISALRIQNLAGGLELDHLQYGLAGASPPAQTATATATETPPPTATETATATATETPPPTATATATETSTETPPPTATATATETSTETPPPTATATATETSTETPTATATATEASTETPPASATASETPTPTAPRGPRHPPSRRLRHARLVQQRPIRRRRRRRRQPRRRHERGS